MKLLRRIGIAIAGTIVLVIGILMIVLPGPAILVIPAGLAILAIEFVWAKRCLHALREFIAARKKAMFPDKTCGAKAEPVPGQPASLDQASSS